LVENATDISESFPERSTIWSDNEVDNESISDLLVKTLEDSAVDNVESIPGKGAMDVFTLPDNEFMSKVLFSVLLTIMELITAIVEFMFTPVDIAVLSLQRLFNMFGAPLTIAITAASTAFTRSTTSELINCEIAESWAMSDFFAEANETDNDVVSEVRVDTFVEKADDNVSSISSSDNVASASEVDTDATSVSRVTTASDSVVDNVASTSSRDDVASANEFGIVATSASRVTTASDRVVDSVESISSKDDTASENEVDTEVTSTSRVDAAVESADDSVESTFSNETAAATNEVETESIPEPLAEILEERVVDMVESLSESDCILEDTLSVNEFMSEVLLFVLLTIMELISTILEFMFTPVDIAVLSLQRLFNMSGAPSTIAITAASTAFTRSTTSELINCEITES
jgi:hypothetical protein